MASWLLVVAAPLTAQVPPVSIALTDPLAITFDDICHAELAHDYSISQVRFALTVDPATGIERWSGFVETLDLRAQPRPQFDLDLAVNLGLTPSEETRQAALHARHSAFLQMHGSFRVQDAEAAEQNYTIHFEAADFRLGRPVYRVAVLPLDPERSAWVLDLDLETGYPLSRSEYAPDGRLLSLLAVVSFSHGSQAQALRTTSGRSIEWQSATRARAYKDPTDAAKAMRVPPKVLVPPRAPQGFRMHETTLTVDPLTGDETLVMNYTDGIASLFYLQTPGAPAPQLPTAGRTSDRAITILDFADATSRQLMFHLGDVRHLVVGSAQDPRLERFVESVVRSARR